MERDFSEIKKLGRLLNEAGIPYESVRTRNLTFDRIQIWYPSQTFPKSDAIVLYSALDGRPLSYGAPLLEMCGLVESYIEDDVQGNMTAEEVFNIWREDWLKDDK